MFALAKRNKRKKMENVHKRHKKRKDVCDGKTKNQTKFLKNNI